MLITILLIFTAVLGLINLVFIAVVFQRNQSLSARMKTDLTGIEQSEKELSAIQNNFKVKLEGVIENDKKLIENTTNNIIKYYQDTVMSLTSNYNLNAQKLGTLLNEDLNKKLDTLNRSIGSQAREVGKVFSVEVQKSLRETDKRVEEYYNQRVTEVETQIYQLINETAKNVMAKSLNSAEHQELVLASLEEAKKDKFFS